MKSTKVITGEGRLSYFYGFDGKPTTDGSVPKRSTAFIYSKDDVETTNKIKAAIQAAYEEGRSILQGNSKTVPALNQIHLPIRDGDTEREGDPDYKNCYFFNAKSNTKPGIVDANLNEIIDKNDVYSGCYARLSITFYAYNNNGSKGIAVALNHIQKLRDGTPLNGRSTALADFGGANDDFLS